MTSFETLRPALFAVAYKMTKSVADAEDILQDIFIRFSQNETDVQHPKAYWVKTVMNRCLDLLEKKKRIVYPGIDLPEPLFYQQYEALQRYDVSYALLLLLQKLNPVERAVFILRETLNYGYDEIAQTLDLNEANCRQLFHRSKEKMAEPKVRNIPTEEERLSLVDAFMSGATGNVQQLVDYLKEDIVIYSDGGGKVSAARQPIMGRAYCLAFLQGLYAKFGSTFSVEKTWVNGEVSILFRRKEDGAADTIMWADMDGHGISALYFIRNPDKLTGWQ